MNKRIYLSSPTMHDGEMRFVQEAFDTNWVAPLGKNVDGFEEDMQRYLGGDIYVAALSAGTAAIHLGLIILGVKRDDEVIASSLTFAASVNPITYLGAKPVLVDSEEDTWNMDPKALRKALEEHPKAKAVVAVNLYGVPAKLQEIQEICREKGIPLLEDAAESLGSLYHGEKTGRFGDIGILSFNGNKIITTSGGGMLVSKNEDVVKKARFLSTQAREPARHYEHKEIGFNYRMSNIVAGIGRGQMQYLDEHVRLKRQIRRQYEEAFRDLPEVSLNPHEEGAEPNEWLTCMLISPDSDVKPLQIMEALERLNIETRPIWKPMHLQPVYRDADFIQVKDGMSVAEDIFNRGLCLPSDIKNTKEDMELIIRTVRGVFGK